MVAPDYAICANALGSHFDKPRNFAAFPGGIPTTMPITNAHYPLSLFADLELSRGDLIACSTLAVSGNGSRNHEDNVSSPQKLESDGRDNNPDVDEDGVHGNRMKPLASFEVNKVRNRKRSLKMGKAFATSRAKLTPLKVLAAARACCIARERLGCLCSTGVTTADHCKENAVKVRVRNEQALQRRRTVKRKSSGVGTHREAVKMHCGALLRKRSVLSVNRQHLTFTADKNSRTLTPPTLPLLSYLDSECKTDFRAAKSDFSDLECISKHPQVSIPSLVPTALPTGAKSSGSTSGQMDLLPLFNESNSVRTRESPEYIYPKKNPLEGLPLLGAAACLNLAIDEDLYHADFKSVCKNDRFNNAAVTSESGRLSGFSFVPKPCKISTKSFPSLGDDLFLGQPKMTPLMETDNVNRREKCEKVRLSSEELQTRTGLPDTSMEITVSREENNLQEFKCLTDFHAMSTELTASTICSDKSNSLESEFFTEFPVISMEVAQWTSFKEENDSQGLEIPVVSVEIAKRRKCNEVNSLQDVSHKDETRIRIDPLTHAINRSENLSGECAAPFKPISVEGVFDATQSSVSPSTSTLVGANMLSEINGAFQSVPKAQDDLRGRLSHRREGSAWQTMLGKIAGSDNGHQRNLHKSADDIEHTDAIVQDTWKIEMGTRYFEKNEDIAYPYLGKCRKEEEAQVQERRSLAFSLGAQEQPSTTDLKSIRTINNPVVSYFAEKEYAAIKPRKMRKGLACFSTGGASANRRSESNALEKAESKTDIFVQDVPSSECLEDRHINAFAESLECTGWDIYGNSAYALHSFSTKLPNSFSYTDSNARIAGSQNPGSVIHTKLHLPRTRKGRRPKKTRKESLQKTAIADKFARFSAPTGLLGRFNPGIISRVRNRKQVRAILGAVVGSSAVTDYCETAQELQEIIGDKGEGEFVKDAIQGGKECRPMENNLVPGLERDLSSVNDSHPQQDGNSGVMNKRAIHDGGFKPGTVYAGDEFPADRKNVAASIASLAYTSDGTVMEGDAQLKFGGEDDNMRAKNVNNCTKVSCGAWDPTDNTFSKELQQSATTAAVSAAASVAARWLELLHLDIKGRLSALKRSRRRVRSALVSGQLDGNFDSGSVPFPTTDSGVESKKIYALKKHLVHDTRDNGQSVMQHGLEMDRWRALFLHTDSVLSAEGDKLERWLRQISEMQAYCQQGVNSDNKRARCNVSGTVPFHGDYGTATSAARWGPSLATMETDIGLTASAASIFCTAAFVNQEMQIKT